MRLSQAMIRWWEDSDNQTVYLEGENGNLIPAILVSSRFHKVGADKQNQSGSGKFIFNVTVGLQWQVDLFGLQLKANFANVELFSNDGDNMRTVSYLSFGHGEGIWGEEYGNEFDVWSNGSEIPPHTSGLILLKQIGVLKQRGQTTNQNQKLSQSLGSRPSLDLNFI